jgi:hypothetical protein
MSSTALQIRISQTVGITSSAIFSGYIFSASFTLIPLLLEAPTPLLLKQWNNAYLAGKKTAPPFAALSSVCYFYLAYSLPFNSPKSKLYGYLLAGALAVGIVPYTLAVMLPTNRKLLAKVEETKTLGVKDELVEVGLGNETAHKLVDSWGVLNLGRAFMLAIGSVVGAWTALD